MSTKRETLRHKAASGGMSAAGIRIVAMPGGVTKVLRVYNEGTEAEPKYALYNITAGMVRVDTATANRWQYVTVRYADQAATNLGYLRYQNMLADSFIPQHQRMSLGAVLGGTRWDNVRDIENIIAQLVTPANAQ